MYLSIPAEPANLAIFVSARSVADTLREGAGVGPIPKTRTTWTIIITHVNQFFYALYLDFQ
jgi:hypothetical protein